MAPAPGPATYEPLGTHWDAHPSSCLDLILAHNLYCSEVMSKIRYPAMSLAFASGLCKNTARAMSVCLGHVASRSTLLRMSASFCICDTGMYF